jgi:serine/threonine-protein kinase Stk1
MSATKDELYRMYDILVKAKGPDDIFGTILSSNFDDIEKHYKNIVRITHPDLFNSDATLRHMAEEATKLLNQYYQESKDIVSGKVSKSAPHVNITYNSQFIIKDIEYNFSDKFIEDDFCRVYFGERKTPTKIEDICLKISKDIDDNHLLINESDILKRVVHKSMPIFLENFTTMTGNEVNIIRRVNNVYTLDELKTMFTGGVPQEHVVWMMDRLLSVIGYLHSNNVIHGGIEPSNILISPHNHNAILIDYALAIDNASESGAQYNGINDFSAPEIDIDTSPHPVTDLYSFGKVMEYIITDNKQDFPYSVDKRIQDFIVSFLQKPAKRPNDAWESWNKLTRIREQVFGSKHQFIPFEVK